MKKKIILKMGFLFLTYLSHSQSRIGITGGLLSSKLIISTQGISINSNSSMGFFVGIIDEIPINDKFFVRPQFLFASKGADLNSIKATTNYLEVPIQLIYKFDVNYDKIFIGFGPYLAGGLSGKLSNGGKFTFGADPYDDTFKLMDFGLSFVGGYELVDKNLLFSLNFNTGLRNIQPAYTSIKTTYSTFGFGLAYFFSK